MSWVFRQRSQELERMDVESLSPETTAEVLRTLETINLWLGGVRSTLGHLQRFSRRWRPGERLRLVDWGTGGGDMPRAIVRWARSKGFRVEITGVDASRTTADYARKACRQYPEITITHDDIFASPQSGAAPFDYTISSLCLHHLTDNQIVNLLKRSDQVASRGIIMNDLKRSARAWAWIWALSRLGRAHPIVQHDGPLSVQRAFTPGELGDFAREAAVPYAKVHTHFGYRLTLAGEKL